MINPWKQGRVPGVPMFPPLGAWMTRRKMASAAYVPPQWARLALEGTHFFFYSFPQLILGAAQTGLTRVTVTEDFWMLAILATATSALGNSAGTFRAQIFEDETAYKYSKYAVNEENFTSDAAEPGLLRMPHYIRAGTPMNCRIQNLDPANPNTVDLCLYGLSTWWRT